MTISSPLSKIRTTTSSKRALVEAQSQLAIRRAVFVERLEPQRPFGSLDRVLGGDAVLERAGVDLHAAK
jgi:hypothetical protein